MRWASAPSSTTGPVPPIADFSEWTCSARPSSAPTSAPGSVTGQVVERTFNAGTKVDTATVDKSEMQYLYQDGNDYVFMDTATYDQIHVPAEAVGDAKDYLLENMNATVVRHESTVLYIELPASVELTITYTEPGVQGDRSTGGSKPATLETGATVQVPLFVNIGDRLKVDTRSGEYITRA